MDRFPHLKITDERGSHYAEASRLALFIGGVPFEDERISHEELVELEPKLPYGRLPVLAVDGELLAESNSILRFAGRLGGLYPVSNPLAALRVDEILHALEEFEVKVAACFEGATPEALKEGLLIQEVPRYFALIDARLERMMELSYFREKMAEVFVHDLALYAWVTRLRSRELEGITTEILDKFRHVNEAVAKVHAHPKVKEWNVLPHDEQVSEPVTPERMTKRPPATVDAHPDPMPQPKLRLAYFFSPGRAEPIRLALAIGDVAFEDEHLSSTDFTIVKPALPFHQLPVLHVNGYAPVAQSYAILRYAGTLSDLYPATDALKALRVDELLSVLDEGQNHPLWSESYIEDPDRKLQMRSVISRDTIPKMLGWLEDRVDSRVGTYSTSNELTIADLAIASLLQFLESGSLEGVPPDVVKPYKNLTRIVNLVNNHPKVKAWRETHPLPTP